MKNGECKATTNALHNPFILCQKIELKLFSWFNNNVNAAFVLSWLVLAWYLAYEYSKCNKSFTRTQCNQMQLTASRSFKTMQVPIPKLKQNQIYLIRPAPSYCALTTICTKWIFVCSTGCYQPANERKLIYWCDVSSVLLHIWLKLIIGPAWLRFCPLSFTATGNTYFTCSNPSRKW